MSLVFTYNHSQPSVISDSGKIISLLESTSSAAMDINLGNERSRQSFLTDIEAPGFLSSDCSQRVPRSPRPSCSAFTSNSQTVDDAERLRSWAHLAFESPCRLDAPSRSIIFKTCQLAPIYSHASAFHTREHLKILYRAFCARRVLRRVA